MINPSSFQQEEVARINAAGTDLQAAQLGVTKINIDTDGRLVWSRDHPENFDLRPIGKEFMSEYAKFIAAKNVKLGSAGQLETVRKYLG